MQHLSGSLLFANSDFIWPFLGLYMGAISKSKMAFIFQISCILALIFPILIKYFPKCEGTFLKSQIKSLAKVHVYWYPEWEGLKTYTFSLKEVPLAD